MLCETSLQVKAYKASFNYLKRKATKMKQKKRRFFKIKKKRCIN